MQLTKAIKIGLVAITLLLGCGNAVAQSSNTGTFSPYTMYGVGELSTPGTIFTRSMGGAGVAMRNSSTVNLLNPAGQSNVIRKSILFNFGVEGGGYYLSQHTYGSEDLVKSAYNNYNFRDIYLQIPLAEGLGLAIAINPYSSVGYTLVNTQQLVDIGQINYIHAGSGGLNEAKFSLGYRLHNKLSVGVAARYYWGTILHSFTAYPTIVTGNGSYGSAIGTATYNYSKIMAQFGVLWTPMMTKTKILNFGATYDIGGNLNPEVEKTVVGSNSYVDIVAESYLDREALYMPSEGTVGLSFQSSKWTFVADYTYKNWGDRNSSTELTVDEVVVGYANTSTYKAGFEYVPNRNDIRKYIRRVGYRAGARYGDYYQTYNGVSIDEYAATGGLSLPIKYASISRLDVGFEWGMLGSRDIVETSSGSFGLIKQHSFKLSIGLTLFGDDYWFQRTKYD